MRLDGRGLVRSGESGEGGNVEQLVSLPLFFNSKMLGERERERQGDKEEVMR
jgi:hypothetical protein